MTPSILIRLPIIPPRSTHSNDLRILKNPKTQKPFIGKSATSRAKKDQKMLKELLIPKAPKQPLAGPLEVEVTWCYPHVGGTRKRDRGRMIPCAARPDVDNLQKGLFDVMTDCGFWGDDGQVAQVVFSKWYGPEPFVEIRIRQAAGYQVNTAQGVLL